MRQPGVAGQACTIGVEDTPPIPASCVTCYLINLREYFESMKASEEDQPEIADRGPLICDADLEQKGKCTNCRWSGSECDMLATLARPLGFPKDYWKKQLQEFVDACLPDGQNALDRDSLASLRCRLYQIHHSRAKMVTRHRKCFLCCFFSRPCPGKNDDECTSCPPRKCFYVNLRQYQIEDIKAAMTKDGFISRRGDIKDKSTASILEYLRLYHYTSTDFKLRWRVGPTEWDRYKAWLKGSHFNFTSQQSSSEDSSEYTDAEIEQPPIPPQSRTQQEPDAARSTGLRNVQETARDQKERQISRGKIGAMPSRSIQSTPKRVASAASRVVATQPSQAVKPALKTTLLKTATSAATSPAVRLNTPLPFPSEIRGMLEKAVNGTTPSAARTNDEVAGGDVSVREQPTSSTVIGDTSLRADNVIPEGLAVPLEEDKKPIAARSVSPVSSMQGKTASEINQVAPEASCLTSVPVTSTTVSSPTIPIPEDHFPAIAIAAIPASTLPTSCPSADLIATRSDGCMNQETMTKNRNRDETVPFSPVTRAASAPASVAPKTKSLKRWLLRLPETPFDSDTAERLAQLLIDVGVRTETEVRYLAKQSTARRKLLNGVKKDLTLYEEIVLESALEAFK